MGQEDTKVQCPLPSSSITEQFSPSSEQVCQTVNKIRKQYKFQKFFAEDPQPQRFIITPKTSINKYAFLAKDIKLGDLPNQSALSNANDSIVMNRQNMSK